MWSKFSHSDTTPNVDYFTRDEVKKMVRDFKEKCEAGELDRVSANLSVHMWARLTVLFDIYRSREATVS